VKSFLSLIALIPLFAGCDSENPGSGVAPDEPGVFILNEGLWGQNNSSLQFFSGKTGQISGDTETGVLGRLLGDTGNSMAQEGGLGRISVTSSNKLVWFSLKDGSFVSELAFGTDASPRESVILPDGRLMISSYYSHRILVVDRATGKQTGSVSVESYPEALAFDGTCLWVSCNGLGAGKTVEKIPVSDFSGKISIRVPTNPDRISVTGDGVLVYCQGNLWQKDPGGKLVKIRSSDSRVTDSLSFSSLIRSVTAIPDGMVVTTDAAVLKISGSLAVSDTLLDRSKTSFKGKIICETAYVPETETFWITTTDAYTVRGWLEGFRNGLRAAGPVQTGLNPGSLLVKP